MRPSTAAARSAALLIFFFLLIAAVRSAPAQSRPAERRLGTIRVTGQKHYTESQILEASGLRSDEKFDDEALNAATLKLGKTGAFEQVSFRYRFEGSRAEVVFTVKEAEQLHPCVFGNFIWGDMRELEETVRREVPLYDGVAPESGGILEEIAGSFERHLKSKGVAGRVERMNFGAPGDPNWVHLFMVKGPNIKIQSVVFEGTKGVEEAALRREAKPLIGRDYSLADCVLFGNTTFVPYYRERGFLRMRMEEPSAKVAQHAEGNNDYLMEVTYRVAEGVAYRWEPVEWSGNQALSAAELDQHIKLKPGEAAGETKITQGWKMVADAYARKGYIMARLNQEPVFEDAGGKVHFRAAVSEGAQFRMGKLEVDGASPAAVKRLTGKWKLAPRDVFDLGYVKEFLKASFVREALAATPGAPRVSAELHPDEESRTVDVLLHVQ